jgi:hypothetical protein
MDGKGVSQSTVFNIEMREVNWSRFGAKVSFNYRSELIEMIALANSFGIKVKPIVHLMPLSSMKFAFNCAYTL